MKSNKIGVVDYLNVIIERKKLIIAIFLVMFVTLFFFSMLLNNTYDARVVLIVEKTPLKLPFKEGSVLFTEHVPLLNMHKYLTRLKTNELAKKVAANIPEDLANDVINRTNLSKIEVLKAKIKIRIGEDNYEKIKKLLGRKSEPDDSLNITHLSKMLQRMMTFKVDEEGVIKITATSENQELVAPLANIFSEIFIEDNIALNKADVIKTRMFIEDQRTKSLADLQSAEKTLIEFKKKMGIRSIKSIEEARILIPELSNLENELMIRQNIYNLLLKKEIDARIREEEVGSNIIIADPAVRPAYPMSSKRNKIRILGFAMGLFLGIGVAFVLEFLNDSVRNSDEVKELFELDIIAEIPNLGE